MTYEAWQQRVIEEKQELDERLAKLSDFIGKLKPEVMEEPAIALLFQQRYWMSGYSRVLDERITLANEEARKAAEQEPGL